MEEHENGFEVAEYDLKLRGPGDILGVRQSGMPIFQIIDVTTDQNVIRTAIKDAEVILKKPKAKREANELQNTSEKIGRGSSRGARGLEGHRGAPLR